MRQQSKRWPRPADNPPTAAESENGITNELNDEENTSNRGADFTQPGISENKNSGEIFSTRGGKYYLRSNPTPKLLKNTDTTLKR